MKYVLALDQGTTSSRAISFRTRAAVQFAIGQREFRQIFRNPAGSNTTRARSLPRIATVAREAPAQSNISVKDVIGVGITNQRRPPSSGSAIPARRSNNANRVQDRAPASLCKDIQEVGAASLVRDVPGW